MLQEQYQNTYKKLNVWMPRIIECLETETINEHVLEFLEDSLNFFYWIAQKVGKSDVVLEHKKAIYQKIQKNLNIDKHKEYQELETVEAIEDQANYIPIWVKNNFEIDITNTDLSALKERNAHKTTNNSNIKNESLAAFTYKNIFNKEWNTADFDALQKSKDLILKKQAKDQIQTEISKGKIYIYKTRPKWNPIIKNFISLLFGFGLITSMIWTIFVLKDYILSGVTSGTFSIVRLAGAAFCNWITFTYLLVENVKNNKNDNFKYLFNKSLLVYQFVSILACSGFFDQQWEMPYNAFAIVLLSIQVVVLLINAYGSYCLNPEKNDKLINDLTEKYTSDESDKHKYHEAD